MVTHVVTPLLIPNPPLKPGSNVGYSDGDPWRRVSPRETLTGEKSLVSRTLLLPLGTPPIHGEDRIPFNVEGGFFSAYETIPLPSIIPFNSLKRDTNPPPRTGFGDGTVFFHDAFNLERS